MLALNHIDFLALWEAGSHLYPLDRCLMAICASLPAQAGETPVADWPLGRRNRALLALHTLYFGPRLEGWTDCAECGEKFEFEIDCCALGETPELPDLPQVGMDGNIFRLPTSRDLALVANETDPFQAAMRLLENCAIDPPGPSAGVRGWPPEKIDAVAEKMAEADPLAEICLSLPCPLCHHTSEEALDLTDFLWTEIEARARRLISEVHVLATAYGWAEAAILALSDVRRATYLQMVQA